MHRILSFLAFLLLLTLPVAIGGCQSAAAPPRVSTNIRLVSANGSQLFYQAKDTYARIRQQDLQGDPFASEMDKALRLLDAAVVNDPANPMFRSKRADLWLELGQFDLAQRGYDNARLITEDWVPSWIGTADIALIENRYTDTDQMLTSAWSAVRSAEGSLPAPTDPYADLFALIGLNIRPQPSTQHPDDPTLSDTDRLRLLTHWLQESTSWTIENPSLTADIPGQVGKKTIDSSGLFRRLRADILYRRARLTQANPPPPAEAEPQPTDSKKKKKKKTKEEPAPPTADQWLDQALSWDPNHFQSKLMRAELYVQAGRVRDAERILRPYLDSPDPKLSNNGRLLHAMANIYAAWFTLDPSPQLADEADRHFVKLHKLNAQHTPGYLDRARFYLSAGKHLSRPDTLTTALSCLDEADKLMGTPSDESQALRAEIQAAMK